MQESQVYFCTRFNYLKPEAGPLDMGGPALDMGGPALDMGGWTLDMAGDELAAGIHGPVVGTFPAEPPYIPDI